MITLGDTRVAHADQMDVANAVREGRAINGKGTCGQQQQQQQTQQQHTR